MGLPGFIGAATLVPEESKANVRYVVWRFPDNHALEIWKNSPVGPELLIEVEKNAN